MHHSEYCDGISHHPAPSCPESPPTSIIHSWRPTVNIIQDHAEQVILLTYRQKVSSNLTLHPKASDILLTASQHVGVLSSHIITRRVSRVQQYMLRESGHIHITLISAYYYNCSILLLMIVINLLLYLIYKLNLSSVGRYRKKK